MARLCGELGEPAELPYGGVGDMFNMYHKSHWDAGLYFKWNFKSSNYEYVKTSLMKNGGEGWTGSVVSNKVLSSDDIIGVEKASVETNSGEKMKRNVDYIGTDYAVVGLTYRTDDVTNMDLDDAYYFKTSVINLVVNDMVVVEDTNGYKLMKVTQPPLAKTLESKTIKKFNKATAWVVDKVDMAIHQHRIDSTDRKEFILKQLEEKKAQMEEVAIYKMLADQDADAALLLAELTTLEKQ